MLTAKQRDAYLSRIGYSGPVEPTLAVLRELQYRHLFSVPYETLDIMNGVPLDLTTEGLYDKIVTRRRGGYCFELNALFGELLRTLGFAAEFRFARYLRRETGIPKRRHQVIVVTLPEGEYLTDVGVGAPIPVRPVRISPERQRDERGCWFCDTDPEFGTVLFEMTDAGPERVYAVPAERSYPVDFLTTSYFCEHSPDSLFRKALMVSLRTPEGRNTVSGNEFRIFQGDRVTVLKPADEREFRALLQKYFGLTY